MHKNVGSILYIVAQKCRQYTLHEPVLQQNRQSASIQLQTKSSSAAIGGGALFAAVFPPPAFLSSIREPYLTRAHTIKVCTLTRHTPLRVTQRKFSSSWLPLDEFEAEKVEVHLYLTLSMASLLLMVETKTLDIILWPVASTGSNFIPMGLYQLAKVSRGTHTVQLEGSGSPLTSTMAHHKSQPFQFLTFSWGRLQRIGK